ncbi:hypothetical protein CHGG_08353 [Chaetomium globosum CBS 148.51]|uniref:MULE transposase domain-containing protein n=1 Tax=Chaetomium globosum (strain ATCC 6205 / CBS 148.51 / DSM 1962 / NBRC 6347 / NRRL 1970) TaxID=306901 RepID=Q2GUK1_CHAGB|nr:uncharacterized protein CHGG_08353 [Chaetomium globosum CBS 148.51]EAQ84339.1 hypothetical protein CHGG_08353 [Chaetomium globosum CBS 148.51]
MDFTDWDAFLGAPPSSELSEGAGLGQIDDFYQEGQTQLSDAIATAETANSLQEDALLPPLPPLMALSGVEEVIETAESAPEPVIPSPPPSGLYDSFDELLAFLQTFHRDNGAAIKILKSANPREVYGERKYTYYVLACDRAGSQTSTSTGIRRSSTQRLDCPFKQQARDLTKHRALPAREMLEIMRDSSGAEPTFFRQSDIYNDRQKIRIEGLNGLSATQAWIKQLQDNNLRHWIKIDDDNKVEGVLWTYPWPEKMWRQFPEVLGLDNTYKTNRFHMYLFEVIGITDQKSVANFAFGLINTEKEDGFLWLYKETALKNALTATFPGAQQQLCVYHINAKVRARIRSRWKAEDGRSDDEVDEAGDNEAEVADGDGDLVARAAEQEVAEHGCAALLPAADPLTRDGMFRAWQQVVYAEDEADFQSAWNKMKAIYNPTQNHILRYISKEYMPYREQWARCFIKRYRNFGQRVNSPVETAHKDVKSFLITGTSDLLHLHNAISLMLQKKERDYNEKAAAMQMRQRQRFIQQQGWLGNIPMTVSYVAVDLLAQQHRLAVAAMPSSRGLMPEPLRPCTGSFMQQYALPCSHMIFKKLDDGEALSKEDVHPRWWLAKPLDIDEPLLRLRDPDVVQSLRGRPRLPNNEKMTVPSSLRADDGQDEAQQQETAQSTQQQRRRQPKQTSQSHRRERRAKPSARRDLSQFEVEGSQRSSQRSSRSRGRGRTRAASSPSTRSSQSRVNSQSTRTARGRSRRSAIASSTARLAAIAAAAFETDPETDPETESEAEDVIEVIPATQPGADEPDGLAGP